jgi:YVTN family beta-propeller protein
VGATGVASVRYELLKRCLVLLAIVTVVHPALGLAAELNERVRRPVAILPDSSSDCLAILNRRSGTVSVVDLAARRVVEEFSVATSISAGCRLEDGRLAVLDDRANELILVSVDREKLQVLSRLSLPASPVGVAVSPDGRSCVVASHWARRLTVVTLLDQSKLQVSQTIDLPFAPRLQLFVDDHRLLVADAFGGFLAMVELSQAHVTRCRELIATHNITGMALSRDRSHAFITHQMLDDQQATTQANVHWGGVMSNVVRRVNLAWFVSDEPEETTAADLYYLGYPDSAAGDPNGVMITAAGRFIVPLGGVGEVAVSDNGLNHFQRLSVGQRPTAMWLNELGGALYVANQMDDTISVIDLQQSRVVQTIGLGPARPPSLADEGERLFYDARLSSDGWYSCHSCHTDGHTNGHRSDTFGDGYRGDPKQVLSLLGTADTGPWGWNGKMPMLEAQIGKSIETTMRGSLPEPRQVQALAAYLMNLAAPPALSDARCDADGLSIERGREIFAQRDCGNCHEPPSYTSPEVYDVGLEDAEGQRLFSPPSLRGVGHRSRLLHDGRAANLREALRVHPSDPPVDLNDGQWNDLERFLQSL